MSEPTPETRSRKRTARELALQILFQVDVGGLPLEEALTLAFEAVPVSQRDQAYVRATLEGVVEHRAELDETIRGLLEGWRLERLANVDKNVLRLALYELMHRRNVPPAVVVNEAVEIAKTYSTAESGKFVNGILGAYLRKRGPSAEADPAAPPSDGA
jgi:N utilization substance protein B